MNHVATPVRIQFVVELARRLHQYGATAARLEAAVDSVSARLDLECNSLSTPTSIILSFSDLSRGEGALAEITQVIRIPPGEVNLRLLCDVDAIADQVIDGTLDIGEGFARIHALRTQRTMRNRIRTTISYGIASAAVAAILHSAWVDLAAAGAVGLITGALAMISEGRPRLASSFEAISALIATLLATAVSAWWVPLDVKSVVLASLIVLMPGISLTTSVRELSTQHLISGVARLAGAVMTLLKLTFGALAATQLCHAMGIIPITPIADPVPGWVQWVALVCGCYSFAVLFQAAWRDYPVVMIAAGLGYVITYYGSSHFTPEFGVLLAGFAIGALGNLYARVAKRPGAVVREPGIILVVPGSVGFRTLSFMFERDLSLGMDMAVTLIALLVSLVAGLLFGDLLIAPRRSL